MLVTDQLRAEAEALHQQGASLEAVMQYLREQGASLIGTISVIRLLLPEPSLGSARDIVLGSAAWSDHKEAFWEFQNTFWDTVDKICEEDSQSGESAKSV